MGIHELWFSISLYYMLLCSAAAAQKIMDFLWINYKSLNIQYQSSRVCQIL